MDKKDQTTSTSAHQTAGPRPRQYPKRDKGLARATLSLCMLVITAVLSACSPSASNLTPVSTPPATSVPQQTATANMPQQTATPNPTSTPQTTTTPQQATTKTQLDPCLLITSQEASTLAGSSFGSGKEGNTPGGLKSCTYGSQTTNVFVVDVVQAPDVDTAKADKAQFLADLQAQLQQLTDQGLNTTELPNFADGAILAQTSINNGAVTINGSAIGVLKGTVFFGFSDIVAGGAAPNSTALQSEATTVIGKLP
jgi:hypothetical protein